MDLVEMLFNNAMNAEGGGGGGGSDFTMASVTITNNSTQTFTLSIPYLINDRMLSRLSSSQMDGSAFSVVLYKGKANAGASNGNVRISATGDITIVRGAITISGDGSITFSDKQRVGNARSRKWLVLQILSKEELEYLNSLEEA